MFFKILHLLIITNLPHCSSLVKAVALVTPRGSKSEKLGTALNALVKNVHETTPLIFFFRIMAYFISLGARQ